MSKNAKSVRGWIPRPKKIGPAQGHPPYPVGVRGAPVAPTGWACGGPTRWPGHRGPANCVGAGPWPPVAGPPYGSQPGHPTRWGWWPNQRHRWARPRWCGFGPWPGWQVVIRWCGVGGAWCGPCGWGGWGAPQWGPPWWWCYPITTPLGNWAGLAPLANHCLNRCTCVRAV